MVVYARLVMRLTASLLLLALAVPAFADPRVVVLSFDGVRHDYLDIGELPAFERIGRDGARAEALVPVFPSSTFPNHVALATGATSEVHGIVGNRFRDRVLGEFDYSNDARFIEAEPVWAAAERQGVHAAAFFWVGSETDWRGTGASLRKTPFDGDLGEEAKVAQILAWLDLPAAEQPRLIMSWWHGADAAGHRNGPEHEETRAMLRRQDRWLGELLAGIDARGLWRDLTLLVVSDHGMVEVQDTHDIAALLDDADIPSRVFQASALANVHLERVEDAGRAVAAISSLPGVRAYRRSELPEALRYDHARSGDVIAVAEPGTALWQAWRGLDLLHRVGSPFGRKVGAHGYDPAATSDVHGIFVALGRGVDPGAHLPVVRSLDVAATITELLGIDPPAHSEGAPIPLQSDR